MKCDRLARRPRVARLGLLWAAIVVWPAGCNTPQIPLPPPLIDTLQITVVDPAAEQVELSGMPNDRTGGASVFVRNLSDGHGVITPANPDGSFQTRPFPAGNGDRLLIDYRLGEEISSPLCISVNYVGGTPAACQ